METHTFEDLITKTGLYEEVSFKNDTNEELLIFLQNKLETNVDMHCIHCKKDSTFHMTNKPTAIDSYQFVIPYHESFIENNYLDGNVYNFYFSCSRDIKHSYVFTLKFNETSVFKIGQFPAVAALEKNDIERYKKLLKKDYTNLNTAIGLRSHGIGAGSYVYLRRIFEDLIEEKHLEAQNDDDWDVKDFSNLRMKEKIKELKHKLPSILIETPQLYGILSKGIHELSEDECKEYFEITKYAIELILDEKLVMLEKEAKTKELKTSLNSIAATILK
ncbi:hypothetical protein ACQKII_14125 [Lysinibacillus sp. NPDC048646]|uniref:hypothetical protein n=1 Tax=Lysinibacillus sp. NPDC048646 TaxID=3390574 RepID=UPI003CFF62C2